MAYFDSRGGIRTGTVHQVGGALLQSLMQTRPGQSEFGRLIQRPAGGGYRPLSPSRVNQAMNARALRLAARALLRANKQARQLDSRLQIAQLILDVINDGTAPWVRPVPLDSIPQTTGWDVPGPVWRTAGYMQGPAAIQAPYTQKSRVNYPAGGVYPNGDTFYTNPKPDPLGNPDWRSWEKTFWVPAGPLNQLPRYGLGPQAKQLFGMIPNAAMPKHYRWLRDDEIVWTKTEAVIIPPYEPPKVGVRYGRPEKGQKETKMQLHGAMYHGFMHLADALGGIFEMIDLLAEAAGWQYWKSVGGSRMYNKAYYLFVNGGIFNVELDRLIELALSAELEDRIIAFLSRGAVRTSVLIGRPIGIQVGLGL